MSNRPTQSQSKKQSTATGLIGKFLILVSIALTAAFASSLVTGVLVAVFIVAAVLLELVKFLMLQHFRKAAATNLNKAAVTGILAASLVCFSGYASYSYLNTFAQKTEVEYVSAVQKHDYTVRNIRTTQEALQTRTLQLTSEISELTSQISEQRKRPDRNAVTDSRIKADTARLQQLEVEYRTVQEKLEAVPDIPVEPTRPVVSWMLAVVFAFLIEASSVVCNFYRRDSTDTDPEIERNGTHITNNTTGSTDDTNTISPVPPVQTEVKQKPKTKALKAEKATPVVRKEQKEYKTKFNIVRELGLTDAERIFLSRYCSKNGLLWKEFNTPDNLELAKKLIKDRK